MRPNPIQSDPCKLVSRTSVSESTGVGLSSVGITRSDCLAMNDSISAAAQPQTMHAQRIIERLNRIIERLNRIIERLNRIIERLNR